MNTVLRYIWFKNKSGKIWKSWFYLFLVSGNKRLRDERAQKDDSYHSRNEQGQRASTSPTKKCKIFFFYYYCFE